MEGCGYDGTRATIYISLIGVYDSYPARSTQVSWAPRKHTKPPMSQSSAWRRSTRLCRFIVTHHCIHSRRSITHINMNMELNSILWYTSPHAGISICVKCSQSSPSRVFSTTPAERREEQSLTSPPATTPRIRTQVYAEMQIISTGTRSGTQS